MSKKHIIRIDGKPIEVSRQRIYIRGKLQSAAELKRYARTNPRAGQIAVNRLCRQAQRFHNGRGRPCTENQRGVKFKV